MEKETDWPKTERGLYICTKEKPMPQELRKLGSWVHDDVKETDYDGPHYIEWICKSCGHVWKTEMPD